ncbi:MAG: SDR family NAD(P)-dependent oxidoreductase [Acidimicrobiia bacterium]
MPISFNDRTVIVTGAGNGLGRAHALELGRLGANVVVNDLGGSTDGHGNSTAAADFVVDEIRAAGGTAVASYDSAATDEGCRHMAEIALASFGRIDAAVMNAGILRNAMFEDMTDDKFFPVLETHLLGSFYLARAVWPTMVAQGYGRLVFTASSSGLWGRPNGINYNASKAGIVGLCNALALEGEEKGILSNALMPVAFSRLGGAPDAIDTSAEAEARREEALASRMAPEWVAPMAAFLASDACTRTHRYYSAVRGRYARVFVGAAAGWFAGEQPPTVDDIAAHLDAIEDLTEYDLPNSTFHEIELIAARAARS